MTADSVNIVSDKRFLSTGNVFIVSVRRLHQFCMFGSVDGSPVDICEVKRKAEWLMHGLGSIL